MISLLSLLEGCCFREGRRDAHVWNPNPSRSFTCKSLFSLLLDTNTDPPMESVLMWSGGQRFVRKLDSLFGKSCLVGLTPLIGLLAEFRLLSLFAACFVGRPRKILIIVFGIASILEQCGALSSKSSVFSLLGCKVLRVKR